MPSSDLPLIYWDACVPLSYINDIPGRLPDIEGILQRSGKDFQLITSVLSVVEVAFALREQQKKALDSQTEARISKLWEIGSPIMLVEFYELLAVKAKNLMRASIERGFSLKPADAIHLATADHMKVKEFQTYDDLVRFSELTETRLAICKPIATQRVIVALKPSITGEASPEESQQTATAQNAPAVDGSSGGHPQSQTGAKVEEA